MASTPSASLASACTISAIISKSNSAASITRFVNDRDLVPRVPPRAFDYTHAGRLIHFDSNGEPDADSQEQRSFLARAFGTISAVLSDFTKSPELIGDHDMTKGYLTCIRNGIQSGALAAGKKLPAEW